MFSTEITISSRHTIWRAIYAGLALVVIALSAGLAYAFPPFEVNDRWLHGASPGMLALWAGSIICMLSALGAVVAHRWRISVLGHDNLQSIRWLSPKEFIRLVEEGFRHQGYAVESSDRFYSRAGIDIILRKGQSPVLVLCRRDPEPARQMAAVEELHAAIAAVQAGNGLLITCELVSAEVKAFAAGRGIAVIEGPALLKLVQRARGEARRAVRREPHFGVPWHALPVCVSCGGPMAAASEENQQDGQEGAWYCVRGAECNSPRMA
jgi:hypothetical protein